MGGCTHGSKNRDDISNLKGSNKKKRILDSGKNKMISKSSVSNETKESDQNGSMIDLHGNFGMGRDLGNTDVSMDGTFI